MIQITTARFRLDAGEGEHAALAAEFSGRHLVSLPDFLDASLLRLIESRLPAAQFTSRTGANGEEIEQTLADPSLIALFAVALNDPQLFAFIERLTLCGRIGSFVGRVYRRGKPKGGPRSQYYPWHNDVAKGRMVGLSVNLSTTPYEGGLLQIRDARTEAILGEKANVGYGDAMLFRISEDLEHQVTPVTSDAPRLVLAGWFCSGAADWRRQNRLSVSK
jgi:hypothetical protein